jgi:hypothetical protein
MAIHNFLERMRAEMRERKVRAIADEALYIRLPICRFAGFQCYKPMMVINLRKW